VEVSREKFGPYIMSTIDKKHKPRDSKPNEGNEPPKKKKTKAGDMPKTSAVSTVKPSKMHCRPPPSRK
jgi:hypothetical protein